MLDSAFFTIWFTGLPCSGKTTLAQAVNTELTRMGHAAEHIDGDVLRTGVSRNLGYSRRDRDAQAQRAALMASGFNRAGKTALVSLVSPYRASRLKARQTVCHFVEIYVRCPLAVCEKRDVKNMYRRARNGEINNFTGVSDPYEEPLDAEIVVDTNRMDVAACVETILCYLAKKDSRRPVKSEIMELSSSVKVR